ncbi:MAG: FecR domain-containing protein [Gammaproteobacteria bacterium]|nr:FecR domain-containing protein [Gammaproteobacteria bacterium]MBL6998357.1 FecR domain-containing protein [Gammaproteobacteria bacterium]
MGRLSALCCVLLALHFPVLLAAQQEAWEYTFRPGDSLWKIAEKYTTSASNWVEIQQLNSDRLGPNRKILPGTRIEIPLAMLKSQPTPARVIALNGGGSLVRANGEQEALTLDTKIYSGDRVMTAVGQNLRIQFADKSELQVLAETEVVFDRLSHHQQSGMVDTRIRLNSGRLNTRVNRLSDDSRYEIRTPAAITAVRGTGFRLSSDSSQVTRTEVSEGRVAVAAGGVEKALSAGYGILAEEGKPLSEPVRLLAAPVISAHREVDRGSLQFGWSALDGAEYYRYQLAQDQAFNQITRDNTVPQNTVILSDLQPGSYYLRVRGVDRLKLEGANASLDFRVQQPVQEPEPNRKITMPIGVLLLIP